MDGATGRRLRAMNAARCRRAGRAGGRGGEGGGPERWKAELEEEKMELAGCPGYSSSAQSPIRGGGVCPRRQCQRRAARQCRLLASVGVALFHF
jgi:hypothetical protein